MNVKISRLAALLIAALFLNACQKKVSGTYGGTCQNQTYGGQGELLLVVNQEGDRISGSLTISGELTGGGDIQGRIDRDTLTFTTKDSITGQITWTGKIRGENIEGYYLVETPTLTTLATGMQNQKGQWAVTRK